MRLLWLFMGSAVLGITATRVLQHVVMVPVDSPAPWALAIAGGLACIGIAIMPADRP